MCFCLPVLFVPIVLVLGFELNTDIYCLVLGWPLHDLCTGAAGCHGLFHQSSRDRLFGHFSFPLVPILFGLANQHVCTYWYLVNLDFCIMLDCMFGHFHTQLIWTVWWMAHMIHTSILSNAWLLCCVCVYSVCFCHIWVACFDVFFLLCAVKLLNCQKVKSTLVVVA